MFSPSLCQSLSRRWPAPYAAVLGHDSCQCDSTDWLSSQCSVWLQRHLLEITLFINYIWRIRTFVHSFDLFNVNWVVSARSSYSVSGGGTDRWPRRLGPRGAPGGGGGGVAEDSDMLLPVSFYNYTETVRVWQLTGVSEINYLTWLDNKTWVTPSKHRQLSSTFLEGRMS